ncbi:MAG: hypothetical protein L6R41_000299 [Letrouitia leprolyta]|nr:MAG: hypothetical protein L6R41_000299 [Letrouitia leprolyta]
MFNFIAPSITFSLLIQSLAHAQDVPARVSGPGPPNAPKDPPYSGQPEDLATFANIPLWPYQSFVTEPDFHPPVLEITKKSGATDGLFVFAPLPFVPNYPDRFVGGLIMDQFGNPIWHSPLQLIGNLEITNGVLKYWSGGVGGNMIDAHGFGTVTVLNNDYTQKAVYTLNDGTFISGDSLQNAPQPSYIDIHENQLLTNRNTLLVTAYNSTPCNLSSVGGPAEGWILDSLVYEIDRSTNATIFRWSSAEHLTELPLSQSYQLTRNGSIIGGDNATHPWDYFLTNAVTPDGDGYILSARHYWSIVRIDARGNVTWILNGKNGGDFSQVQDRNLGPPTFSWQHFVRLSSGSTAQGALSITLFNNNNGGLDNGTAPSTGLEISLNLTSKTAKTARRLIDPEDELYVASQGSYESLPGGGGGRNHTFLAYGQVPKFKEFDAQGNVVMDARFGNDNQISSYRSSLIPLSSWTAAPYYPPKYAMTRLGNGSAVLSMSWNGATSSVYDGWVIGSFVGGGTGKEGGRQFGTKRTGFESNCTVPEGGAGGESFVVRATKGGIVVGGRAVLV